MFSIYRRYRSRKSRNKKTAKDKSRAYARQLKRKIKKCELCGKGGYLEVHHRNGNPLDNKLNNLRKLCLDCHIDQHKHQRVVHLMKKKLQKHWGQQEVDWGPLIKLIYFIFKLLWKKY